MANNKGLHSYEKTSSLLTTKSAEISLITLERAQKLDLLIHLLANLRQSLVICGPKGIGKSTLLSELKLRKNDVWLLLTIKASSKLSFESIQEQISHFVQQSDEAFKNQDFSTTLSQLDKQNQKIVILIEEAGQLVPGLISALIQYASVSHSIRMVFSLTHDELHLKISSDSAIDNCHFIEIPPLSQSQCEIFLQHLSRQAKAIVPFHAINERMIAKLYQKTHGIPGKIMSELPSLSNYSAGGGFSWGILFFLALMVTATISFFMLVDTNVGISSTETKQSLLLPKAEDIEIASPVIQKENVINWDKLPVQAVKKETQKTVTVPLEAETGTAMDLALTENTDIISPPVSTPSDTASKSQEVKVVKISEKKVPLIKKPLEKEKIAVAKPEIPQKANKPTKIKKPLNIAKDKKTAEVQAAKQKSTSSKKLNSDALWVLAQANKQYTIQLMVLSSHQAVLEFLKKNDTLKKELHYFKKGTAEKTVFVLIYGSYNNFETASKEMKSLPPKYRKSWVRNFAILQKSINNKL